MRYRAYFVTTVSSLAMMGAVTSAGAADLPVRRVVKAPPALVEAPFSWTGFYAGVHAGYGWGKVEQTTTNDNGFVTTGNGGSCDIVNSDTTHCSFKPSGGVFGGFAGYNWQSGKIVFGVEADGSWTGLKHAESFANSEIGNNPVVVRGEVRWLATARGRLGVALSPTLLYVTGGVAFGGVNSGWANSNNPPDGVTVKTTETGWVVGGGIEHAFSKAWSVRAEVLYHDLGRSTGSTIISSGTYTTQFRHTVTTARAGLALRW